MEVWRGKNTQEGKKTIGAVRWTQYRTWFCITSCNNPFSYIKHHKWRKIAKIT